MDDTVVVTGGAGFIGSTLVDRLLAESRRVVVVDDLSTGRLDNLAEARRLYPGQLEFVRMDISAPRGLTQVVARHRPDVIYHLAAQISVRKSVEDPRSDLRANVLATLEVVEAAREVGARKVVMATSGGCIYGEPAEADLPVTEDMDATAHSPYGASKRAAEEYLRTWGVLYDLRWTTLALANVYGPRQDPRGEAGVIAIFTERMLAGQPCTIYGDGEQTRDFVHVDDVVHAFVLAGAKGDDRRFNIGTSQQTSVKRLHQALAAVTGHDQEPVFGPERAGELRHSAVDPTAAAEGLGWRPFTSLEQGLASTLEWARTVLT